MGQRCSVNTRGPAEPRAVPAEMRGSKGHASVHGGSLSSASHGMQVHRRDRGGCLLTSQLRTSRLRAAPMCPTGQLSHGNLLLSRTVQPPKQGRSKDPFSDACGRQKAHRQPLTAAQPTPVAHYLLWEGPCGQLCLQTAWVKQHLCPSLPSLGHPGAGQSHIGKKRQLLGAACPFHSNAFLVAHEHRVLLTRTANFCTLQEGGLIHQSCKGGEEVKMEEATRNGVGGKGPRSIVNLSKMQQHKNFFFFYKNTLPPHPSLWKSVCESRVRGRENRLG